MGSSLPELKQKRNNNITGIKTKTKQNEDKPKLLETKYWKKNKQTQNTGKIFIKEDIPSSPGEYPWGPLYRNKNKNETKNRNKNKNETKILEQKQKRNKNTGKKTNKHKIPVKIL